MAFYIINEDLIKDKHQHIRLNQREYNKFNQIKELLQESERNRKVTTSQTWIYILNIAKDKPVKEDLSIKDTERNIRQSIRINNVEKSKLLGIKSKFKKDITTAQLWRYCLNVAYTDLFGSGQYGN